MPRSEHDKFVDHVSALLRALGVDVEDVAARRRDALFKDVRQRRLNEHEAALAFAYALLPGLLDDDVEEARVFVDRLSVTAESWDDDDLIDRRRLAEQERDARAALRRAAR